MAELASTGQKKTGLFGMPKLPVTGLFLRLVALVIDLILIVSTIHLLVRYVPGLFWSLGVYSRYLTGTATFLYFVLLNGPVGKGQTVGKMILKIRTTDLEGQVPSFIQSAQRTLILFPIFALGPLASALWGTPESVYENYYRLFLTQFPMISMFLATLMVIPFNPFKQGLHDFYAQTLVRPLSGDDEFSPTFEEMTDEVGLSWPKVYRQPQYSGLVTFTLVFLLFAYMGYPGRVSEVWLESSKQLHALNKINGLENAVISATPTPKEYFKRTAIYDKNQDEFAMLSSDDPTTGSTTLILPVFYKGDWKKQWDDEKMKRANELLAINYHDNILPLTIKLFRENQKEEQNDSAAAQSDLFLQLANEWENNQIDLMIVNFSRIWVPPYPYSLEKVVHHEIKSFSPLIEKKDDLTQNLP